MPRSTSSQPGPAHACLLARHSAARLCAAATLMFVSMSGAAFGCASSGEPTVVKSAPLPKGWPSLTPVGEVQVKSYPAYRAAVARREEPQTPPGSGAPAASVAPPSAAPTTTTPSRNRDRAATSSLFMVLFRHIDDEGIPMTAPVRMDYSRSQGPIEMSGMAFLYESQETGEAGPAGDVVVEDVAPRTVVSVGVRGDYTTERMEEGLALLERWLETNAAQWQRDGDPMYLGYNGPFTPSAMRYGEVQIPVRERPQPESPPQGQQGTAQPGPPGAGSTSSDVPQGG